MVDCKENYKFDVGVKGLTSVCNIEILIIVIVECHLVLVSVPFPRLRNFLNFFLLKFDGFIFLVRQMYTQFVNGYDKAIGVFQDTMKENSEFADIVAKFQVGHNMENIY